MTEDFLLKFSLNSKSKAFDWNNNSTGKEIGLDRKLPAFLTAGARDLVKQMLTYDPDGRPTSQRVMNHPYFNDVRFVTIIPTIISSII